MKQSEFKRWLEKQGVEFEQGAKHYKLTYKGKRSTLSRQPSKEMKEGTRKGILKQLGLDK
ncbi:mRNA interferase [Marinomonas primoryensis]|uniref:mRNA interferase n=1 Tax=Marinomonas primoryensis TaxID=178399 RepID=A0A2Z4PQV2_9GAMM|nr:type II toxin-antitoxin system HicA family toxin [Marinomonas primoryensis]AWX99528.1 mRNA interferase [Marinomonas primoryensis]